MAKTFNTLKLRDVVGTIDTAKYALKEIELDIYNEHTINPSILFRIPSFNIDLVVIDIIKEHNYVIKEINNMTIREIEDTLQNEPDFIINQIHDSYVIESVITDSLYNVTKNQFFIDSFYIWSKYYNSNVKDMLYYFLQKYYDVVYTPIITKLREMSKQYLQFAWLMANRE